ncbi:AbrB/MazE/SpoVT family DNA-binding domain-containing protein [Candidatus Nitrososphaera gargensis]|nr:AbrB/MazE/SpoVT family DNA-binding domain-containing protein [Candidatus Nitrososphaera gargensis]
MDEVIITVTKNGQIIVPKKFREKHHIADRAIVVDTNQGVLIKPVPDPLAEIGSLKRLFKTSTSKKLLDEARSTEVSGKDRTST